MAQVAAFSKVIRRLQLHPGTPVAVAVSGGSDSIALTHLCRHVFKKVLAITVDHRLRPESSSEAGKVGEIVRGMGVEHQLLTLDWDTKPPEGKVQVQARDKRYGALLEVCQERDIGVLMTGHHLDDQLETFIFRLVRGSGIDGLAGMYPVSFWPTHSDIKIVRPLLKWTKEWLVKVCRGAGLEWVEDQTNAQLIYWRNAVRQVLVGHPELFPGLQRLSGLCEEARGIMNRAVLEAVWKVHKMNSKLGYMELKVDKFQELSPPVAMRTLFILTQYVSGVLVPRHVSLKILYNCLKHPENVRPFTGCGCFVDPTRWKERGVVILTKELPKRERRSLTPIHIGETVTWDNRFEITLIPLGMKSQSHRSEKRGHHLVGASSMKPSDEKQEGVGEDRTFYIRHMVRPDEPLARKGIRRVRSSVLPPANVRSGLPVIVDDEHKPVLVPHFQMIDRSAGVTCKIAFKPTRNLDDLLKDRAANSKLA